MQFTIPSTDDDLEITPLLSAESSNHGTMGKAILERIRVRDDDEHGYETTKWINPDIAPLPPNRRTWGVWAFLGFGSISK